MNPSTLIFEMLAGSTPEAISVMLEVSVLWFFSTSSIGKLNFHALHMHYEILIGKSFSIMNL